MKRLVESNPSLLAKKVVELEEKVEFILNFLKIPANIDFNTNNFTSQDVGERAPGSSSRLLGKKIPPRPKSKANQEDQSSLASPVIGQKWVGGGEGNFQCQVCGLRFRTELKLDYHKMKLKHRKSRLKKTEELSTTTGFHDYRKIQIEEPFAIVDPLEENADPLASMEAGDDDDWQDNRSIIDQSETDKGHETVGSPNTTEENAASIGGMKLRSRKRKPEVDSSASPLESDNFQDNIEDIDYQPKINDEKDDNAITAAAKSNSKESKTEKEIGKGNVFPCPVCGVRFPTQAKLNSHKTNKKHVMYNRINGTPKITCEICGHKSLGQVKFKKHYAKHSKDKPFLCSLCGKGVKHADTLKLHMKMVHETEGKTFQCKYCQSWHKSAACLRTHYLIHEGKMDEMCPHCGKMYAHLRRHIIEVHEKVRAFECHLCEHKFKKKSHLDRHLESHAKGDKRRVKGYHVERPEVYARRKCEKKVVRLVGIGESSTIDIGNGIGGVTVETNNGRGDEGNTGEGKKIGGDRDKADEVIEITIATDVQAQTNDN